MSAVDLSDAAVAPAHDAKKDTAAIDLTDEQKEETEEEVAARKAAEAAAVEAARKKAEAEAARRARVAAAEEAAKKAKDEEAAKKKAEEEEARVPLQFSREKKASAIELSADGAIAMSKGDAVGVQLCDHWMASGSKPLIYTVAVVLDDITPQTVLGVVGRNFFPSDWDTDITKSTHAVLVRCGDGKIVYRGKETSFILRKLTSGAKLNFVIDMQTLEMTIEVVGKDGTAVSEIMVERIPSEVTFAVGFVAGGAPQSVRVVGCKKEKPGMLLMGKFRKDLWDDENVQKPLPLNTKKEHGALQAQNDEIKIASTLQD